MDNILTYETLSREELIRECKNKQAVIDHLNEVLSETGDREAVRFRWLLGKISQVEIGYIFPMETTPMNKDDIRDAIDDALKVTPS